MIRQIKAPGFHTAWWGRGYDEREVDDFLDGIAEILRKEGRLDAALLHDAAFTITWLRPGYVITEVDDLLSDLANYADI